MSDISISKLRQYETCPRAYFFKYELGIEGEKSEALQFGKEVHEALSDFHKKQVLPEDPILKLYLDEYAKYFSQEYEESEYWFEVPLLGLNLRGYIDLVKDGWIIEYKTASRKSRWNQDVVDSDIQGTGYAYAYRKTFNKKEKGIKYIIFLKKKKPEILVFDTTRNDSHFRYLERWGKRIWGHVQKERFHPTPGIHCRWCSWRGVCDKS